MNRRQFLITPLGLLAMPLATKALADYIADGEFTLSSPPITSTVITIEGNVVVDPEWVDTVLIPAIRDTINNRDFVIINHSSRQARDL